MITFKKKISVTQSLKYANGNLLLIGRPKCWHMVISRIYRLLRNICSNDYILRIVLDSRKYGLIEKIKKIISEAKEVY